MNRKDRKKLEQHLDDLWKTIIKSRSETCTYCQIRKTQVAHHIFSCRHWATRWDLRNGIPLCNYCHRFVAHGAGSGFEDWIKSRFGHWFWGTLYEASHARGARVDLMATKLYLEQVNLGKKPNVWRDDNGILHCDWECALYGIGIMEDFLRKFGGKECSQ